MTTGDNRAGSRLPAADFDVEDALFDTVPYRAWSAPNGTAPAEADPGDRRVIGRLAGVAVTVTDLPPHTIWRGDVGLAGSTHQYFEIARDFLDWIVRTASGTRYLDVATQWDEPVKNAAAEAAVRTGLHWDADGNILVMNDTNSATQAAYVIRLPTRTRALVYADNAAEPLDPTQLQSVLDRPLNDVCTDDVFTFTVEVDDR